MGERNLNTNNASAVGRWPHIIMTSRIVDFYAAYVSNQEGHPFTNHK